MNSFAVGKLNLKHIYFKYLPESREEMGAEINCCHKIGDGTPKTYNLM